MPGEGIRRRGKRWVLTMYDASAPGGTRHVGTYDSQKKARIARSEWEIAKDGVRPVDTTCDDFQRDWCTSLATHARPAETTNTHNRERTRLFAADFAGVKLRDVTRPMARAWALGGIVPNDAPFVGLAAKWKDAKKLKTGVEVQPRKAHVPAVRSLFTDARRDGIVAENPWIGIGLGATPSRKDTIKVLTPTQLDRLVAVTYEVHGDYGDMFAALILMAAYTGMRPGELYALQWENVDFGSSEVTVEHQWRSRTKELALPKNTFPRTIVLPPPAATALMKLPRSKDGFVFQTKRGKHYTARVHHFYWNPVRTAFGRPGMDFYELRHFCGSYLADKGASAADIALQLGHRDGGRLAMGLYIHSYEDNARERIRRLFATEGTAT